jgi:hypothetical protein
VSEFNFWTPAQIAEELKVSHDYILQIISGQYPLLYLDATKLGGRWLITEDEARRFIREYRSPPYYTPQDIAEAIGMTRKYVLDALTGYGGRKEPRLAGEKRGDRWVISREEGDRFIGEHRKGEDVD